MPSQPPSRRMVMPADSPARQASLPTPALALVLLAALALLLAACGASSTPAPTVGANGVAVVAGAAVSGSVGPEGGELTAADPGRGRSYRLSVPAGAFAAPTEVTLTPIAAIEGFPLEGGLLGGVELTPEGATFLVPVTLEISLDPDARSALRSARDAGQAVVGFDYAGDAAVAADDLGIGHAEVADDGSTIRLTLFGFSGHGAGAGNPQKLANRPCRQNDPARRADCEITKILAPVPPGQELDPATAGQVAQVFRDWLDELEVVLDASTDDPADYRDALGEAIGWQSLARHYNFLTALWYAAGDYLDFEGARLQDTIFRTYADGIDQANRDCPADRTVEFVLEWLDIHELAKIADIPLPALSGIGALGPSTFCLDLQLVAESSNPTELDEGASGVVRFRIESGLGTLTDTQLSKLKTEIVATPADASLVSASGDWQGLVAHADVTALSAIRGRDDEGEFTIALRLFDLQVDYAIATATFDITPGADATPAEIRCSGDPTTIRSIADDLDKIAIISDGAGSCSVLDERNSRDDDPNIVLRLDTDPDETRWDGDRGDGGINWTGEGEGDGQAPGTYRFTVRHVPSGTVFTLAFTVELSLISGGPDVTMTVRDVTLTPTLGD